jgi:hypothetical protein
MLSIMIGALESKGYNPDKLCYWFMREGALKQLQKIKVDSSVKETKQ